MIPRFTIDLNPSYQQPRLTISYFLPDSPPEVVEQEATAPLENALSQISQVEKMYSISNEGSGTIELTFDRHTDFDFKRFEVASAIRQLYPRLHPQLSYPQLEQRDRETESKKPLLIYRISAALAPFQIRSTVKDIFETDLARIDGISAVGVTGAEGLQITIAYDYDKLSRYDVPVSTIKDAISQQFASHYPGFARTASGQNVLVTVKQSLNDLSQLENVTIPVGGSTIRLKDIATVFVEERDAEHYFRINGLNSTSLVIYASDGVNRLALARQVNLAAGSLANRLPEGCQFQLQHNDTAFVARELKKNYFRSGLAVGILTLFMFLAYRNWKHILILFAGLAVNLSVTALIAFLLGISIHLYTIAGLTISFGMMIDNLIIMLDHLQKQKGSKVFRAIVGATLTTIMALLMVLLLPEEERNNLTEFAIIVSVALGTSIIVATFFIPALHARMAGSKSEETMAFGKLRSRVVMVGYYSKVIALLARSRKTFVAMLVLAFGLPVFLLPNQWEGHGWYNRTIGSDFYQENLRPYVDPLLGGALRPFVRNVYERGGYREPERTRLYVRAELPYGNTLEEMNRIIQSMETYLQSVQGIENFVTTIQSGQYASIEITFQPAFENGALPFYLKNQLIARSLDWSGVSWSVFGVGQGFSNSTGDNLPSYRVEMRGYNYQELERQADKLADKLLVHPRIQKVNTNERLAWNEKPGMHWTLDLNSSGVHPGLLAGGLKEITGTHEPDLYLDWNNERFPVSLESRKGDLQAYEVMNRYMRLGNRTLKLAPTSTLSLEKTASAIHKEDRQYIRMVGFEYYGSHKFGNEYLTEVLEAMSKEMPQGYTAKKVYWDWGWEKAKRQYGLLLLLIAGVYFLGSVLLENLRQPFYIMLSIPLSFIGLFLAFAWGEFYFDQGGYAAFVLLGGIAVNASIFIINDLNNLRQRNYNRAVIRATTGKMRPILLTILSTCLGLTPFLVRGQNEVFWFSLAIGTIGGLIVSIFVFTLVVPVLLWKNEAKLS